MIEGPENAFFTMTHTSGRFKCFVLPLGFVLLGLSVILFMMKFGWTDGFLLVTARDVPWRYIVLALVIGCTCTFISIPL
jgi:hypothetical protein